MSRIGKIPVEIPENVQVELGDRHIVVKGQKGELEKDLPREVSVKEEDGKILLETRRETKKTKSMHGTYRALIANMVTGVSDGWKKELELVGTGYRAELQGKDLKLTVGYSHPVVIEAPEGVNFNVEKTNITVEGIDKELVGKVAAKVRDVRPPEPYKGKGIKYKDEVIRRKPGKAAKGAEEGPGGGAAA